MYPIAAVALAVGVGCAPARRLRRYRSLLALMGASAILVCLHLVPLPPLLWHTLPGRDLVIAIDKAAGVGSVWRPLSLSPAGTLAALFALTVPAAALSIGMAIPAALHRRLALLVLTMGGLSALLGMIQIVSPASSGWYLHDVANHGLPVGLFANRNHQAAMLACLLPMLAWLAQRSGGTVARRRAGAFLAGGAGIGLIPLILVCGSRAGVALALVGMAGAAWIIASAPSPGRSMHARRAGTRRQAILLAVGGAALVTLVAAIALGRSLALERLQAQELDGEFRLSAWRAIWTMVRDYLPLGSGIGSFREVYRIGEPYDLLSRSYLNHAHNDALELLLTGGLPAVVILFAAVAIYIGAAVRLIRRGAGVGSQADAARLQLGRVGTVVIAILAAGSIVDYPLRVPSLACFLMLAAIWLASALRPVGQSVPDSDRPRPT